MRDVIDSIIAVIFFAMVVVVVWLSFSKQPSKTATRKAKRLLQGRS